MLQIQRASAGSGKTYTLAKKFIWFLIAIKNPDRPWRLRTRREIADGLARILAITFTNKATNEMKLRIVDNLASMAVAAEDPVSPLLLTQTPYLKEFAETLSVPPSKVGEAAAYALSVLLNEYSDFRISTIDSFFQSVLRTFAYESNLNDSYQVEIDTDYLIMASIDATLNELNRPGTDETPAGKWIRILTREASENGGKWNVFQKNNNNSSVYSSLRRSLKMIESEDFKEIRTSLDDYFINTAETLPLEEVYVALKKRVETPVFEALERARGLGNRLQAQLRKAGLDPATDCLRNFSGHLAKLNVLTPDVSSSDRNIFSPLKLAGKSLLKKGVSHPEAQELTDMAIDMYEAYNLWLDLRGRPEWVYWQVYAPLLPYLGLLGEARLKMNEFLESNNLIQLGETNSMLQDIIGDDDAPFIYERLGSVINHFLIDEFQDTSRMQWDNLHPLLKESDSRGEDNLIIGDAKQSIYRFRNADPSLITTVVPSLFPSHKPAGLTRAENTNWRSRRRIVEFNNLFFSNLAGIVDSLKLGELDFKDLYSNVAQYSNHRDPSGYVEVRFMSAELSDEDKSAGKSVADVIEENVLKEMGPLIASLQTRGVAQKDIAILTDTNEEGKKIIAALVEYNENRPAGTPPVDFISEEALLVSQSEAVGILVAIMRYLATGADMDLSFFSLRHPELSPAGHIAGFLGEESPQKEVDAIMADMQARTLTGIVEAMTEKFVPEVMRREQAVYLAAFQDMVIDYTDRYPADAASFLDWWDSKGRFRSISSPEGTDAVRIMTIHKSKGLEFGCVILPFADGALEPSPTQSEWRWVKPASVFSDAGLPPFVPVKTERKLMETEHASIYIDYHDLFMMDKLNSAYVAFTRAVDELYIFTRESRNRNALGPLLKKILLPPEEGALELSLPSGVEEELLLPADTVEWDDRQTVVCIGEKPVYMPKDTDSGRKNGKKVEERVLGAYNADSTPAILHIVETEDSDLSVPDPDEDPRSEGNLLHAVMERVKKADDLHAAVLTLRMRGMISLEQAHEWEPMLEKAMKGKEVAGWFDGSWRVANEREIILPGMKNRRPDRLMFNSDRSRAIVVDYKFGSVPDGDEHIEQVREYVELIRLAVRPKNIEGFIWYVREGKIVRV